MQYRSQIFWRCAGRNFFIITAIDRFDYCVRICYVAQRDDRAAEARSGQPRAEHTATSRAFHNRVQARGAAFEILRETMMRGVHERPHFVETAGLKRVRRANYS